VRKWLCNCCPIHCRPTATKFLKLWPTGKIPLLLDDDRVVPETSVMIEYLQQRHAPEAQLLPSDTTTCLQARLWDRLFDNYVMTPVQSIVGQQLRNAAARDAQAADSARTTLAMAYGMIEQQLADGREWTVGSQFSIADCAAAPSLFYAATLVPFDDGQTHLKTYFERLIARPSVQRVLQEAKPWFKYYPFKDALPSRFTA
jgi:glutathione S-transferase